MNCKKYNSNSSGNVLTHFDRSNPDRKYGNQDIDPTRTHLNYNLAPIHEDGDFEFMKNRCQELKALKRRDVNTLVSWVITIPKDYTGNEKEFFIKAYTFFELRYGKENVVSSYVHKDEVSPHMHFAFVPAIYDKKKDRHTVNAKKCISRVELQRIHPEIQTYLEKELNTTVNILNGATKGGNKSIQRLKEDQKVIDLAVKELVANPTQQVMEKAVEKLEPQVENLLMQDQEFITKVEEKLKEQKTDLRIEIVNMEEQQSSLSSEIIALERKQEQKIKNLTELSKDDPEIIDLAVKDLIENPTTEVLSQIIDKQMEDIHVPSSNYEPVEIKRISADEVKGLNRKEVRAELQTKIAEVTKLSMQNFDLHHQNKNMKDILNVSKNSKNLANTTQQELNDLEKKHTLTKSELDKLKEKYGKLENTFHFFIKKIQTLFFWVTNMLTQQQKQQNPKQMQEIKDISKPDRAEVIKDTEKELDEQVRQEREKEEQRKMEEREKRHREHDEPEL